MSSNAAAEVQKALGEPLMPEFTDYMRRVRSLLIVVSLISIGVVVGELAIDPDSSVLGIRFQGLSDALVRQGLLIANSYLFIHFLWGAWDSWFEWSARVTGTRVAFVTTGKFASEHADYPSDPRQSTLYNWWKDQATQIGSLSEPLQRAEQTLSEWEKRIENEILKNDPNLGTVVQSVRDVRKDIEKLQRKIESTEKTIEASRIPVSLRRFDQRFQLMLRSQSLRWLLLELGVPLLLGGWAVILLINGL